MRDVTSAISTDVIEDSAAPGELVDIRGMSKIFDIPHSREGLWAVRSVDLQIRRGETLGLVGESGSGKTTLGRCVLGLEQASKGRIFVDGVDVTTLTIREFRPLRRLVQPVFQDPSDSLNPSKTAAQIIDEPLRRLTHLNEEERRSRVLEVLDLVHLPMAVMQRYPANLTGGEQQRVAIARALSTRPALLILDEPTSRLDVTIRGQFLDLLARLQKELDLAYVFISHDLTAVRRVCQRLAIMYLGEIVEEGPASEIFDRPAHPYTKGLLSAVLYPDPDRPPGEVQLTGEIPIPLGVPKGCALAPRCPHATDLTRETAPPFLELHGRKVRCHYADEMMADDSQGSLSKSIDQ